MNYYPAHLVQSFAESEISKTNISNALTFQKFLVGYSTRRNWRYPCSACVLFVGKDRIVETGGRAKRAEEENEERNGQPGSWNFQNRFNFYLGTVALLYRLGTVPLPSLAYRRWGHCQRPLVPSGHQLCHTLIEVKGIILLGLGLWRP